MSVEIIVAFFLNLANIYLLKVSYRNTKKSCEICSDGFFLTLNK